MMLGIHSKVGFAILIACVMVDSVANAAEDLQKRMPNILIVFTDDQGYADLGCYGSKKHKTPRVDRLADEGTRFTDFYAQPVCGPSRSALLTGRYPFRSKGWAMPASEVTFAECLKSVGYQTCCIGKWDVSNRKSILDRMPNAQGFDYYFGPLGANDNGIVTLHENNLKIRESTDMASLTRLYTDKAIDFLTQKRDPDQPFLLYLSHTMMHTNIDASPEFKGKSKGGLYGDVVEEFDYETGRLLDTIDELQLRENTLVIYTSDNGPWCQTKYTNAKMGLNIPDKNKKNQRRFMPEGTVFWGDRGPLRGGKGSAYEAGSRVPCIVRWPGKVPSGRVCDSLWATIDFLPTFARLTGFELPTDRVIDGVDQTELLSGQKNAGRGSFLYSHAVKGNLDKNSGIVGIRDDTWKLLLPGRKPDKPHRYLMDFGTDDIELYNLKNDISETTNVAAEHPDIVDGLKRQLKSLTQTDTISRSNTTFPNAILIVTDDQGYGDVQAHDNPLLKTLHLDRLTSESARFTDFHVAPMGSPTRGQ